MQQVRGKRETKTFVYLKIGAEHLLGLASEAKEGQAYKRTRKREFLEEMQRVVPWSELIALIEPRYPKGKTGRPSMGIATMLSSRARPDTALRCSLTQASRTHGQARFAACAHYRA